MTAADVADCAVIDERSSGNPLSQGYLLKAVLSDKTLGYVAEFNERIVGFALVKFKGRAIEVVALTVDKDYRRMSFGSWLMASIRERMDKDFHKIVMRIPDSDLGTHLFLRDCGFMVSEIVRSRSLSGDDIYVFETYFVKDSVYGNGNNHSQ